MSLDLEFLGERIKDARERVGLSQEQLAKAMRRDQRSISQYENGKRKVMITDLPLLAELLQVPIGYFFEGDEVNNIPDKFETQLLIEFRRLGKEDDKSTAVEMIRLFSDAITRSNF